MELSLHAAGDYNVSMVSHFALLTSAMMLM